MKKITSSIVAVCLAATAAIAPPATAADRDATHASQSDTSSDAGVSRDIGLVVAIIALVGLGAAAMAVAPMFLPAPAHTAGDPAATAQPDGVELFPGDDPAGR